MVEELSYTFVIEDKGRYKYVKMQEERLDLHSAPKLIADLCFLTLSHRNSYLVLNISNLSFCDASGLTAIQALHRKYENEGGMLIVTGVPTNIEKLIKICMLDLEWNIAKDLNEVETLLTRRR